MVAASDWYALADRYSRILLRPKTLSPKISVITGALMREILSRPGIL
jgi:hypothetical protein